MELTIQDSGTLTFESASAGGDYFNNNGNRKIILKNDDSSAKTITFIAQEPCNQGHLHDKEVDVPAGEEHLVDNIPTNFYNDENGDVQMTYSSETSLTIAVING